MELARITQLLEALGPDWPEVAAVDRTDEATWLIEFDEDLGIVVECLEEPASMVLTAPLGRPEVDRRFTVYENLLMFNSLWQEMAGARVALTGPDGEVILAIEIGELPQTASALRKLLGEWCDVAREWRTYVLAPSDAMRLSPLPFMELATRA